MADRKRADIDIAARAAFESAKLHTPELQVFEWDRLDPPDPDGDLHPMFTKGWYRQEVCDAVEALWRAGRLS